MQLNLRNPLLLAVGALIVMLSVQTATSASLQGKNIVSRTRRSARKGQQDASFYPLLCPKVVCMPVSRDCQYIEMIVFEYSRLYMGKMVDVRCESCEYCLDMPSFRRRRSLAELLGAKSECPDLSCPMVPSGCTDVRTTNIAVGGRRCNQTCPACFDGTVVASRSNL